MLPPIESADFQKDLLQKVTGSVLFQKSARMRELLLYICERNWQNRPEDLSERAIGCAVFGRAPDYNPSDDNIVRVEMRQLRKRLEEYFNHEGCEEPCVITIPKGAYIPVFQMREATVPDRSFGEAQKLAASAESSLEASSPVSPRSLSPLSNWFRLPPGFVWQVLLIVALSASALAITLSIRQTTNRQKGDMSNMPAPHQLWSLLFNKNQHTTIVCADSAYVIAQQVLRRPISLESYIAKDYSSVSEVHPELNGLLTTLPHYRFTDMTDLRVVQKLHRLNSAAWDSVSVQSARSTVMQDLRAGNAVLLGSPRSNPWGTLFDSSLNFVFDFDEQHYIPLIRNKAPHPGERAVYFAANPAHSGDALSLVSLVPNLSHTGKVLLIAGTSAEGTEAAAEFITNANTEQIFLSHLTAEVKSHTSYFEVLLRSKTVSGTVSELPEILAIRTYSPPENSHF